ncbi:MAG: site-specific integrase [Candidatus Rokuibacteriota bacterium]|nr:MAG: site-specific integrase [Candidatus Rokubacteria bacterium]
MGSLYRPKLRGLGYSRIWWCKYYVDGRPIRESTGIASDTETAPAEARRFLKVREGAVATGQPVLPRVDRIRYEELAADLRRYYQTTGKRRMKEAETRLRRLDKFFVGYRVAAISPSTISAFVEGRQKENAANATINRELATLRRMLRLAYKGGKLLRLPVFEMLKERAPREGFFERDQYESVRRRLRPDLQVATMISYTFGWRTQSEVLTLERRHLDLEAGTLRLDPGMTKNDEGRIVYLTPELKALLATQLNRVETLQRRTGKIIPYLFPHLSGRRAGARRRDFRKAWTTACEKAGVAGRIRHDFRRTAVRNMVNAGVPERVAMKVTGHKTRAVFDRYHIVSPADLQDVARRLAGTFSGTSHLPEVDPRLVTSDDIGARL